MAATKRTIKQSYLATHIIAELFGCQKIDNLKFVDQSLKEAAHICGATVLHTKLHKFSPQGITGYVLLAESHISVHTWPEYGYAAADIFSCGTSFRPREAANKLAEALECRNPEIREIARGLAIKEAVGL